jgi:hypothetical protein
VSGTARCQLTQSGRYAGRRERFLERINELVHAQRLGQVSRAPISHAQATTVAQAQLEGVRGVVIRLTKASRSSRRQPYG